MEALEKLTKADHRDIQIQSEEFNGEPSLLMHYKFKEDQSKITRKATLIHPGTLQEVPNERDSVRASWTPVTLLYLGKFKEAVVSYGIQSAFVKQMLNTWSVCNRIIPTSWIDLVKAALEPAPQLHGS